MDAVNILLNYIDHKDRKKIIKDYSHMPLIRRWFILNEIEIFIRYEDLTYDDVKDLTYEDLFLSLNYSSNVDEYTIYKLARNKDERVTERLVQMIGHMYMFDYPNDMLQKYLIKYGYEYSSLDETTITYPAIYSKKYTVDDNIVDYIIYNCSWVLHYYDISSTNQLAIKIKNQRQSFNMKFANVKFEFDY